MQFVTSRILVICWLVNWIWNIDNFTCKLDLESRFKKIIENELNCTLILSDDAFVLFEMIDSIYGKIIFWSSLYAIVDIQLNKVQKTACINFYSDENVFLNSYRKKNSF